MVHSGWEPVRPAMVHSFRYPVNYVTISFSLYSTMQRNHSKDMFRFKKGPLLLQGGPQEQSGGIMLHCPPPTSSTPLPTGIAKTKILNRGRKAVV